MLKSSKCKCALFSKRRRCTLRGIVVHPEVMIPLTGTVKELEWIQPRLERIAALS